MAETATAAPSPNFTATNVPTATIAPSPRFTVTNAQTATATPTQTLILTPTYGQVEPPIELYCPVQPEVSLAELGVSTTSRLIVVPSDDQLQTLWSLVGIDMTPERIPTTPVSDMPFLYHGTSPDQHWFTFYAWSEDGLGFDLWISSIDGKTQWLAVQGFERLYSLHWVNDQTIIIFERSAPGQIWPETFLRLNPFTTEIASLESVYLDLGVYAFSPDASQVIYLARIPYTLKLHDYQTDAEKTIFPWLETSRISLPNDISLNWTASGVSAALMDSSSLDLAINIPPAMLGQRYVSMQRVLLPGESTALDITWWSSDSGLIAVKQAFGESEGDLSGPAQFYTLDTTRWVLYDYCLPEELYPGIIHASADDRFLAWAVRDRSDSGHFEGTVIMEPATGRRAWLRDMVVIGWGEVSETDSP